jgi:monothiol glutaredoxin
MTDRGANPFKIADPQTAGSPAVENDTAAPALERVGHLVRSADVFVFMKGQPEAPMCGFSANTVAMLNALGVPYSTFDVLADHSIRSAAKEFAQWPTFPQVWIRGELVGGNDIVSEMFASGELAAMVEDLR